MTRSPPRSPLVPEADITDQSQHPPLLIPDRHLSLWCSRPVKLWQHLEIFFAVSLRSRGRLGDVPGI